MRENNAPNSLQKLLYAAFRKKIHSIEDVREFSKKQGIPFNTVKDYFYKGGAAGISTINQILEKLFDLNENKVAEILEKIENDGIVNSLSTIYEQIFNKEMIYAVAELKKYKA